MARYARWDVVAVTCSTVDGFVSIINVHGKHPSHLGKECYRQSNKQKRFCEKHLRNLMIPKNIDCIIVQ